MLRLSNHDGDDLGVKRIRFLPRAPRDGVGFFALILSIRADARVKLVTAIARGRQWLSEIETGTATVDSIAAREACSKRHVSMTISLA
jgi:hypothetical protein